MKPSGTIANIMTVDLEEWFHICGVGRRLPPSRWSRLEPRIVDNTLNLLGLFGRHKVRATFFVLGWVARRYGDLVREIVRRGHEIASHGYGHQRVYTLSHDAFRKDVERSLDILAPLITKPIIGYRAPEWSIRDDSLWALKILTRLGFRYDASMAPLPIIGNPGYPTIVHRRVTDEGELWEIPPLVGGTPLIPLPLGGGWGLRVFPYRLIRYFIRRQQQRRAPAVLFVHPRELDGRIPSVSLPLAKRFVLTARVQRTQTRLERLLKDYAFVSIGDYLAQKKVESKALTIYL